MRTGEPWPSTLPSAAVAPTAQSWQRALRRAASAAGPVLEYLTAHLGEVAQRRRQRRALARLDDRLLRDIGIDREQARREVAKPFWRR